MLIFSLMRHMFSYSLNSRITLTFTRICIFSEICIESFRMVKCIGLQDDLNRIFSLKHSAFSCICAKFTVKITIGKNKDKIITSHFKVFKVQLNGRVTGVFVNVPLALYICWIIMGIVW